MILFDKILKGIMKPHKAFNMINIKYRTYYTRGKAKLCNKKIIISKSVTFKQKTIFTGSGTVIMNDNISVGYQLGGYYHNNVTEFQARFPNSKILIGPNVSFNNSNFIVSANRIELGSDCLIGANVTMMDFEAHRSNPDKRTQIGKAGEIIIGKNVWIGNNVIILKNAYIGDNSIVAAGSVVIKGAYPQNSIIGGNPARVIKTIILDEND